MKAKKFFIFFIFILLLAYAFFTLYPASKEIMFSSNIQNGINRYWKTKVDIKEVKDFEAYGKKYKLVLSTPISNEKYKYLNCYEEKMNGLYYKNYQGSKQGDSNDLFSFSTIYVNSSNKENYFTVVYGYNKDLEVASYEMKISGHEKNIISNVSRKKYFIDAYEGNFQGLVNALDKDGKEKNDVFCD